MYRFFFFRAGWKITGDVPRHLNKYIIAVAPHTSNWDFLLGLAVRSIMKFQSNFLGKKELFTFPFGWLFRKLGGYPVDRKNKSQLVEQVAAIARNSDHFVIAIAPEGTRKAVSKWKTGFYHIAFKAGIPIVFCSLDYKNKNVSFYPPFYPCGDFQQDAPAMKKFYVGIRGKNRNVADIL